MSNAGREPGYVVIHRQVMSSAVWGLPDAQFKAWVALLFAANFEDSTALVAGRSVTIPRGSALTTIRSLADRARVSKGVVERALTAFRALGMVTFTDLGPGTKGGTTVRLTNVLNYQKFQDAPRREQDSHGVNLGVHLITASPTEKRAAKDAAPKASPFPPAFWRLLKHFSCPPLDRADKGQLLQRMKAGEPLEDLAVKLVTGFSYGAKTGRGALGFTRQFNDPITRLEMDDVRSAYRRLSAQEHRLGDGAGRRAGDSATQPPAQLGLPEVGAADAPQLGVVHGPGRKAGPVQDDLGVDDGGESRASWEASLLDRPRDAPRADGGDVGLAAGQYPTQEAGGCVETGRGFDFR